MSDSRAEIRAQVLYEFRKGNNAAQAARNICDAHGGDVISERTCARWFTKFRSGDFSLAIGHSPGRPAEAIDEDLETLLEEDPHQSSRELAQQLQLSHTSVLNHLHKLGKVKKLDRWVPHQLSAKNKEDRVGVCQELLKRHTICPFLDRILTCDEKWCLYENYHRSASWLSADQPSGSCVRRDIHCGKVMLCVWWNVFGIVHHELLPANRTLNSKTYCEQLDRVEQALIQKHPSLVNRKGVLILQDNARPHVSKETRQKMEQLKWELLPHPPYSPDIAPSDFHLFQSLSHHLANKHYRDRNDIEIDIAEFFMSKPTRFYHDGIYELPKRWQSVVDCRGEYLPD